MHSKQKISKLKKYLLCFAMLIYLAGTFHMEIFEAMHILSHQLTDGYSPHSHDVDTSVHDHDHEHELLDIVETALEKNQNTPVTQKEQSKISLDKIVYQKPANASSIITLPAEKEKIPSANYQFPDTPFIKIIPPPPQFCV